jgi:hypothetical protein
MKNYVPSGVRTSQHPETYAHQTVQIYYIVHFHIIADFIEGGCCKRELGMLISEWT